MSPEDDEYLLILEAIGFMTLIWREVPTHVQNILAASEEPGRGASTNAYLIKELRVAVKEAIDVPSYADIRQIASSFEEQQIILRNTLTRLQNDLDQRSPAKRHPSWLCPILSFLLGIILTLAIQNHMHSNDLPWIGAIQGFINLDI